MNMTLRIRLVILLLSLVSVSTNASASADVELRDIYLEVNAQNLREGFYTYNNLCRLCHNLKYIKYSNLSDVGLSKHEIDVLRGTNGVSDTLAASMPPSVANQAFGKVPPDLSLMAKARKNGTHYIYTLLTSYYEKSEAVYDNHIFQGIRMPDIFEYSVTENPKDKELIDKRVQQVALFLEWAADPKRDERKSMGVFVIAYLMVLTLLLFFLKRRIWANLQ